MKPSATTRLNAATRATLVVAALGLVAVLATAARLQPDPRGHGTHTQLGLPPCAFLAITGRRCPCCGMTTAFAWTMRGRFDQALLANPAGTLLVPACLVLVPWLLHSAAAGRPGWGARTIDGPIVKLSALVAAIALVTWTLSQFLGRV